MYFNFQRHFLGGYARSYNIAKESVQPLRIISQHLTLVSIGLEASEIFVSKEIRPSNGINLLMAGISFTGVGALVAAAYFMADVTVLIATGNSIGDMVNNEIGTYKFNK